MFVVNRGAHAADDGSFNRSAAVHTGRAAILLVVAFLIGVGLLHSADRSPVQISAGPTTTKKSATTTSSTTSTTVAPLRDPKTIKVLAANGTSTNGIGDKVRRKLLEGQYDALTAVTSTVKTPTTIIYFTPGFDGEAAAVATFLGVPVSTVQAMPTKPPVAQLGTANILVVAGNDLATALASSGTTTTVRSGTATTVKRTTATTSKSTTTTAKSSSSSTTSTTARSSSSTTSTSR
jgi:hypothetical protein